MKNKILIIDDSNFNCELLSAILGNEYTYDFVYDGYKALEKLSKENDIDIILLDINMPKISGLEILEILNKQNIISKIPVIIISSENDNNFIQKAYELGASDYITRPFSNIVVKHRVRNTLMLYSTQKRLMNLVEAQIYEREKTNNAMISIFSNIIELRNHESKSHTLNVQTITSLLFHQLTKSNQYNISENDISLISTLAALHDIGKIKIPESILNKPGKLTNEEWKIMKKHTLDGEEILLEANIDQNSKFMHIARDICRHHHEKYDGLGYPDGLKGDDIPLSAQVVSLADVYDALTSDRCYKKAYSHEEAIQMILNGECGAFNPILLDCLKKIEPQLKKGFSKNQKNYDYHNESIHIANEILAKNNLPIDNITVNKLESEKEKRLFFEENSSTGIQFEYNKPLHTLRIVNNYEEKNRIQTLYTNFHQIKLLSEKDAITLYKKIKTLTKQNNSFEMLVLLKINNTYLWHKLKILTLWQTNDDSYFEILGQFTNINDQVLCNGLNHLSKNEELSSIYKCLKKIFPVVRIVDPINYNIIHINNEGKIITYDEKCYHIWNRNECCSNCTSIKALKCKKWLSKLESKNGDIFAVLSKYIILDNKEFVLEIAFPIDSNTIKNGNRFEKLSSLFLLDFYKDSLTDSYTRTYLEDFKKDLTSIDALAILDVNNFKKINDNYGHLIGDIALTEIAKEIKKIIKNNILIRYGGDEFLILFEKIEKEEFNKILLDIQKAIANITIKDYENIKLSISIGGQYHVTSLNETISKADKKMYNQKKLTKTNR